MAYVEIQGVVVDRDPTRSLPGTASAYDGLYLRTDDGRYIRLVSSSMVTQLPVEVMWRESRADFAPLLGQRATVEGYLSGRTLYSATLKEPLPSGPVGPVFP